MVKVSMGFTVRCDRCGWRSGFLVMDDPEDVARLIAEKYWESDGPGRHVCPACVLHLRRHEERPTPARSGFTLIELLAVLAIVALIAAATLPVVLDATARNATGAAARLLQGELAAALARAQRDGEAGIRLVPDPGFPVRRLADGSVDPTAPLVFSRIVPIVRPPVIHEGRVSIRGTFPSGFPALGTRALVLEQEVARTEDGARLLNDPTAWAWRVRVGDRLELRGRTYTVCGPTIYPNSDRFVNYDAAGTGLDRGDGPAEWLLLVNGVDDDGDGWIDNGWDGRDENGDGVVDDPEEWTEVERWGFTEPVVGSDYLIRPRPAAITSGLELVLGAAVIDATGWADPIPTRSVLPVDRLSGVVDLVVASDGSVTPPSRYAPTVPSSGDLARPCLHFWISDRGSIDAGAPTVGSLVTVHARTGRTSSGVADPADPMASYRATEGGGL